METRNKRFNHALSTIFMFRSRGVSVDYDRLVQSIKFDGGIYPNVWKLQRTITSLQKRNVIKIAPDNQVYLTEQGLEYLNEKTNVLQEILYTWLLCKRSVLRGEIHKYFAQAIRNALPPWDEWHLLSRIKFCDKLLKRMKHQHLIDYVKDNVWVVFADWEILKK